MRGAQFDGTRFWPAQNQSGTWSQVLSASVWTGAGTQAAGDTVRKEGEEQAAGAVVWTGAADDAAQTGAEVQDVGSAVWTGAEGQAAESAA